MNQYLNLIPVEEQVMMMSLMKSELEAIFFLTTILIIQETKCHQELHLPMSITVTELIEVQNWLKVLGMMNSEQVIQPQKIAPILAMKIGITSFSTHLKELKKVA
mgnify:CR=1 FL=1